jgi:FkbM family methyltransferase
VSVRNQIAHATQRALANVGLHVSKLPPYFTLGRHLMDVFAMLGINVVLDVGAYHGTFARWLRTLHYKGEIISFEPAAATYARLVENMKGDLGWRGEQAALSDVDGTADLHIARSSDFNSFHEFSAYGRSSRYGIPGEPIATERVRTRRLDDVIEAIVTRTPDARILLKLDTQGHDLRIVEATSRGLESVRAIQTELSSKHLYCGVPSLSEALARYECLGYVPTGFFPVSRELDSLAVIEWDCVLQRG